VILHSCLTLTGQALSWRKLEVKTVRLRESRLPSSFFLVSPHPLCPSPTWLSSISEISCNFWTMDKGHCTQKQLQRLFTARSLTWVNVTELIGNVICALLEFRSETEPRVATAAPTLSCPCRVGCDIRNALSTHETISELCSDCVCLCGWWRYVCQKNDCFYNCLNIGFFWKKN